MEHELPMGFLDVPVLLESSQPQPRMPWAWFLFGGGAVVAIASGLTGGEGSAHLLGQMFATLIGAAMFVALPWLLRSAIRRLQAEQAAVRGVAEMIQLRLWPQAAVAVQQILSRPARTPQFRSEAILYLGAILARYHRFQDAIRIYEYLLEHELVAESTAHGLRLGRAMAMLHEDHLFDADRAISELRRDGHAESAGLALVEIYRDVKTGHPDDALQLFDKKLSLMRNQLGHRVGDAYALAARAYDLLDRRSEAADAFRRATLLAPLGELCRRYPEIQKLAGRYEPTAAPPEMA